jgi:hypothetical protein
LRRLFLIAAFLILSHRVAAANITWDGGGSNNNWSEAANWSGDTVPGDMDIVFFDGMSTKNATIDLNINVKGLRINSGYIGTITQAGSSTITVGDFGFAQSTGTYNGGSGDIDVNAAFNLIGGTFNSTTGTLFLGGSYSHDVGGAFNHNNGTVTFDGGGSLSHDFGAETFNNLNFNNPDGSTMTIFGSPIVVLGALALNDGKLGGTVQAQAGVTVSPNFDGGSGTLNIIGAATRTITFATGTSLINVNLNAPNVTLQTSGSGTLNWQALTLQAGTINQGSVNFVFQP